MIGDGLVSLLFFYRKVKGNSLQYLSGYLKGNNNSLYDIRSASQTALHAFRTRAEKFKNSFFPLGISEWIKLNNFNKAVRKYQKI